MPYTPREYAEMHFIYGECRGNARRAAALYRERYPNRNIHPDYRVFIRVHNSYSEGKIPGAQGGSGRPRRDDLEDEVLEEIENDPSTSVRSIERRTGIKKSTVHDILKRHQLHPFHVQRVQSLLPTDYPKRLTFCRRMLRKHREDTDFFNKILWTDESSCHRRGIFNIHNLHSWNFENPHIMRPDRFQHQFKINLWTGILNGHVIGPFEFPPTLNSENYLEFLQIQLTHLLEDVPLEVRQTMWFQHDGCPAHYGRQVREYLDRTYAQRWIGRLGPILWPPRSPDLNPLDFFYWGCLKEKVYHNLITSEMELRNRIRHAAQEINNNPRALRLLKRSFLRRCHACIRAGGKHFEHLL